MNQKFKRYFFLGLTVFWMIIIFAFSHQQANQSASLSSSLTFFFLKLVYPKITVLDINEQMQIFDSVQFFIRKAAHMSEYALLWLFSYQFLKTYDFARKKMFWLALGLCFFYACTDEFHQAFVPGRGPAFSDVLIDTSGGLIFGILYKNIEKWIKRRK